MSSKKVPATSGKGGGGESKSEKKKDGPGGLIKTPGDKKAKQESAAAIASKAGRRAAPEGAAADAAAAVKKDKGKKEKTGGGGGKKKKKGKPLGKKPGCILRCFNACGVGFVNITLIDPKAVETCQILGLEQSHLRRIKASFDRIDLDGSGSIDCGEFLESMGEQRSPFTDKLFASIDIDGSGTIELEEFVRVLSTYCMFTKDEILRFAFECFDVDGSGTIDEKEFIELCKTVNNASPTFPANFKGALLEFDVNEDGLIDFAEFLELDRRYPLVLFPAFRLQDRMQKLSMGEMQWHRIVEGYSRQKKIDDYKAQHGGRAPPDPFLTAMGKMLLPCLFTSSTKVRIGTEASRK